MGNDNVLRELTLHTIFPHYLIAVVAGDCAQDSSSLVNGADRLAGEAAATANRCTARVF